MLPWVLAPGRLQVTNKLISKYILCVMPALSALVACVDDPQSCVERLTTQLEDAHAEAGQMMRDSHDVMERYRLSALQILILGDIQILDMLYRTDRLNECDFHVEGLRLTRG